MLLFVAFCTFISLFSFCNAGTPTQTDMDTVHARLLAQYTPAATSVPVTSVIGLMTTLLPNGSWPNIDYSNQYNFPPSQHLAYIQVMAGAYVANGTKLTGNATLIEKIHLAYNYWFTQDYVNGNWWWNEIGFPDYHGPICLLLQPYLTAGEKANCTKLMYRADTDGMTGANLVWTAQIGVWNGIFNNNISLVTLSTNLIWETSVYFSGNQDGVKRDASFFQHGQIEYSGGYGSGYTVNILAVIKWTVGTNFNIPDDNLESLSAMALDGQQWMIAYPKLNWDISCKGREITRSGNGNLAAYNKNSGLINPGGARSTEWDAFLARLATPQNLVGNKAYWMSDYMIHSRTTWMTSVKMTSTRVANNECVNSEGKQSVHLSDGANYLYQAGDEYFNVFALWDWHLIPGTTTDQVLQLNCSFVRRLGKTSFVGVVSDGMYGAAAHDLLAPWVATVSAKKSWYLFDDEYIALGAGISSASNTTIEQRNMKGNVSVATGQTSYQTLPQTARTLTSSAWWVHHDNVGYVFPNPPSDFSLVLDSTTKTGNWDTINTNDLPASGPTFLLYMPKTSESTYSYIVIPATNLSNMPTVAASAKTNIQILSNTATLQAVYHSVLKQLHATFWNATSVTYPNGGFQVSAIRPSLLMLIPSGSNFNLVISDPTQLLAWTAVSFNTHFTCTGCTYASGNTVVNVTLPTGDYAGQTVKVALTLVGSTSSSGSTSTSSSGTSTSPSSSTTSPTASSTTSAPGSTSSSPTSASQTNSGTTASPTSSSATTSKPNSGGRLSATSIPAILFFIVLATLALF